MQKCQPQVLLPAPFQTVGATGWDYCPQVPRFYPAADCRLGRRLIIGSMEDHTRATGGRG